MTQLVKVPLEGGGSILVEADDDLTGVARAGRPGEVVAQVEKTLESYLDGVQHTAQAVIGKLKGMAQEIDVELGIKLSAKAGVVIANSAAEANIRVTIRWKRDKSE